MIPLRLRISVLLGLLTFAVFCRVLGHDFIELDDREYVTENSALQSGLSPDALAWAFTTNHAGNWHPVTWLFHLLDCQIWGLNARGHHAGSLLLHMINALLLFHVLTRMTGAIWKSAFVAALFAIHPLHVESVAWVAERKDLLSGLFWLSTMEAYCTFIARPNPRTSLLVIALFALGLMSKPMLVTLPFVLLLLDFWPLARTRDGRNSWIRLVLEKIPLITMVVVSSIITLLVQHRGGAVASLNQFPLKIRVVNATVSYAAYLVKMIWPAGLSVYYPYRTTVSPWVLLASLTFLTVVSVVVLRCRRRCPYLLVGWFWFLGTLVPVIGLVQVGGQAMADRYTYIPLIGPFIMLAWGIPDFVNAGFPIPIRPSSRLLAVWASGVVLVLSLATFVQLGYWQNGAILLKRARTLGADNALINYNLGLALTKQGEIGEAIQCFEKTLREEPDSGATHGRLAELQAGRGNMEEAARHFSEVVRLQPDDASSRGNLAICLASLGQKQEALTQFRETARLKPNDIETQYNLAFALADQGLFEESMAQCRHLLQLNPDWPPAVELTTAVEKLLKTAAADTP